MSQSSDDAPTGPISGAHDAAAGAPARDRGSRRWNLVRDVTAGVLLVVALFLPWNLYFGVGIPDSRTALFAVLGAVTLLSLLSPSPCPGPSCALRFGSTSPISCW